MPDRTPIVGGNWKMNTTSETAASLAAGLAADLAGISGCDVVVYPPFPYLAAVSGPLREVGIAIGVQDFYPATSGAFTGEIGMEMLTDLGVRTVLVGHSERRHVIREPEDLIAEKTRTGLEAGLDVTLCVGETLEEREAGQTDAVNLRQLRSGLADVPATVLDRLVVAYEPVWAIGTGRTATPEDAESAHLAIRKGLEDLYDEMSAKSVRIQYGGSVKANNATALFEQPNIDGGLIGGASLKTDEFLAIVQAAAGPAS